MNAEGTAFVDNVIGGMECTYICVDVAVFHSAKPDPPLVRTQKKTQFRAKKRERKRER